MPEAPANEPPANNAPERRLRLLLRVGELLNESLDYQTTVQNVCSAIVEDYADICLLDLGNTRELRLAAAAHHDVSLTPRLQGAGQFLEGNERGPAHPVWHVLESGQPVVIECVDEAYLRQRAAGAAHERFMRELEYGAMMIVPVASQAQGIIGTLTFVRTRAHPPFAADDLAFAIDLARRCATAIVKAMLFEQTQMISTLFQRAALPQSLPAVDGMSFDAFYEPSSEDVLVGGDWYDAFVLPDHRVAITVGDVLGHGVEAAVWMSRLRNSLRAALFTDPDPARALAVADQLIRLESDEAFTTALVAIVDPIHQTMSCASAGHPGPMVFEPDGSVTDRFVERTLPLGLRHLGDDGKAAQTISLRPGTFAAFFTDGLLEWNRDIAAAWDLVQRALQRQDVREAAKPARRLRDAVINGFPHQDDVAILTLRIDKAKFLD